MQYCIYPLESFDDYKKAFEARYKNIKKYLSLEHSFYKKRYEIEYYDLHAQHFGLRNFAQKHTPLIGFGRLTLQDDRFQDWAKNIPHKVKAFLHEAFEELKLQPKPYPYPVYENSLNNFPEFKKLLDREDYIAELGRLIILETHTYPYLAMNLVCYMWAAALFQGIDYLCIQTLAKPGKFYDYYFKAYVRETTSIHTDIFPALYKLDDWAPTANLIADILEIFRQENTVAPILFDKKNILKANPTLLSLKQ